MRLITFAFVLLIVQGIPRADARDPEWFENDKTAPVDPERPHVINPVILQGPQVYIPLAVGAKGLLTTARAIVVTESVAEAVAGIVGLVGTPLILYSWSKIADEILERDEVHHLEVVHVKLSGSSTWNYRVYDNNNGKVEFSFQSQKDASTFMHDLAQKKDQSGSAR